MTRQYKTALAQSPGGFILQPMIRKRVTWLLAAIAGGTVLMDWLDLSMAAIWPSLVALILVFSTRKVLMGLLGGAVVGAVLLSDGRIWLVPLSLVEDHLLPNFSSSWKTGAIIFTLLLGGFVHLLEKGGILQDLLVRMLHGSSARRVETGAGLFGLVCFFDGLANSLMVGRIFQPMALRAGLTRVRLAYIVDTTSAAVACLAFISTWIAYQLAMIREGFVLAGHEELAQPYRMFFLSLPHNYYAWFALILMGIVIFKQWNVGPMSQYRPEAHPEGQTENATPQEVRGLWRAGIPIASLLAIVFLGIYADGTSRMSVGLLPFRFEKLAGSFAEANVPAILVIASGVGALLAWMFFPVGNRPEEGKPSAIFVEGMIQLFQPVLILVMAWMLSSTLQDLNAGGYLGGLLGGKLPPAVFPAVVFLTGALVAFTTGTSWGTMGLLMPLAIPLGFSVSGNDVAAAMSLLPMVIGAVFSGAVFGDHCSPISDTTIVSSIACGIDPMDHVRTQLPYALIAATGASVLGFMPVSVLGGSPLYSILSTAAFYLCVLLLCSILGSRSTKA